MRAAKVDALAGVLNWIRFQWPPSSWRLVAVEADLAPGGRPDLWWGVADKVVADEIKTGLPSRSWETQFEKQRFAGTSRYGEQFLGIRVFTTSNPSHSLWVEPDGTVKRLHTTRFWFTPPEARHDR